MKAFVDLPIWREYEVSDLARRLELSESYVLAMKWGRQPLRPRFRRLCARVLRRSEAELFAGKGEETDGKIQ